MEKIYWDLTKERFLEGTKSVIICNHCGWLIHNPIEKDKDCCNCGENYKETKSGEKGLNKKERNEA